MLLVLASISPAPADPGQDNRAPDVGANTFLIPPGGTNKVHFHAYAIGVQIYTNDTANSVWKLKEPMACLFDAPDGGDLVGIHYAGPTWESESGSFVKGAALTNAPSPNANSIRLLLIKATSSDGPGIFDGTTYIQRMNTMGGVPPAPPTPFDTELSVHYTAEYYFYRGTR